MPASGNKLDSGNSQSVTTMDETNDQQPPTPDHDENRVQLDNNDQVNEEDGPIFYDSPPTPPPGL